MTMTARKPRAGGAGELLSIVRAADQKPLLERGRLMNPDDIVALLANTKTRKWVNKSFLPSKRVKIGRSNVWWECDVTAALESGDFTA